MTIQWESARSLSTTTTKLARTSYQSILSGLLRHTKTPTKRYTPNALVGIVNVSLFSLSAIYLIADTSQPSVLATIQLSSLELLNSKNLLTTGINRERLNFVLRQILRISVRTTLCELKNLLFENKFSIASEQETSVRSTPRISKPARKLNRKGEKSPREVHATMTTGAVR